MNKAQGTAENSLETADFEFEKILLCSLKKVKIGLDMGSTLLFSNRAYFVYLFSHSF